MVEPIVTSAAESVRDRSKIRHGTASLSLSLGSL